MLSTSLLIPRDSALAPALLAEAERRAQSEPGLRTRLEELDDSERAALAYAVYSAKPEIAAEARHAIEAFAKSLADYRSALLAWADERRPDVVADIKTAEEQHAAVEPQLQEKHEEEAHQRRLLSALRRDRELATPQARHTTSATRWRALPWRSRHKEKDPYQQQMEQLQITKKAIVDVVTHKKLIERDLESHWKTLQTQSLGAPAVRAASADATAMFDSAADVIARDCLPAIYETWLSGYEPRTKEAIEPERVHPEPASGAFVTAEAAEMPVLPRETGDDFDVFISHAREDKEAVARPLNDALVRRGVRVWLDEQQLKLGDRLSEKIDDGLARSRYGIVILSPNFFSKHWPKLELDSLFALESRDDGRRKVILPIWHGLGRAEVTRYSPLLAGLMAVDTAHGIEAVAESVVDAIEPSPRG